VSRIVGRGPSLGPMDGLLRRARLEREGLEHDMLAPLATKADQSLGRVEDEPHDEFRTAFERDRDRVVHAKAFRRLKHKTQVFLNPDGDHFVTRMTHTIQVNQVAVRQDGDQANCLVIEIQYEVKTTHDQRSLVYPFYLIPEE